MAMLLQSIEKMLQEKDLGALKALLGEAELVEIVSALRELQPSEQVLVFRLLDKERALELFESLSRSEQSDLVRAMEDPDLIKLVEALEPDKGVELFGELPAKVAKRVLAELSLEARQSINLLLGYPENSAGRIMNPNYLALTGHTTARQALQQLIESPLKPEHLEVVLVIGEGRQYLGYVTTSQLLKAPAEVTLGALCREKPTAVSAYDSQDRVAEMFLRQQLPLIAVVDKEGRLVGAIDAEKGLELAEEREAQRMTVFGGTVAVGGPDVDIVTSPFRRVFGARVFWLILLTVFGIFTSNFVAQQEELLSSVLILAAFIAPIIDMGGNTGSQTATLVIRAMALGQTRPRLRDFLHILKRDIPVALAMGVTIAVLEAILAYFSKGVGGDVLLVVGLSMLAVTVVGSLVGVALPFIARRLGFDPATLSSPVITSVMDLLGIVIYFGFAYYFLSDLIE
jgi:magnesium transporter